jgi:hypothetical protein
MDLRHLAVILDVGSKAAADLDDPGLSNALTHMAEIATVYALHPDGGTLFPLDEAFAALAARLE